MTTPKHPLQRLVIDEDGVFRFRANHIVVDLYNRAETHAMNLNKMTLLGFSWEDWDQFYQLRGHRIGIWSETEYATNARMNLVDRKVQEMRERIRTGVSPANPEETRRHRMQPIVAVHGVARFKQNNIVDFLVGYMRERGFDLNNIAYGKYTRDDRNQFAQLIGYSVSGFGDLSYARKSVVARADRIVDEMRAAGAFAVRL